MAFGTFVLSAQLNSPAPPYAAVIPFHTTSCRSPPIAQVNRLADAAAKAGAKIAAGVNVTINETVVPTAPIKKFSPAVTLQR